MDIKSVVAKLVNMAHKLKSLKHEIDDQMIISKLLGILPAEYKQFSTAWESMSKTERTLKNLTARSIAEEGRYKKNGTKQVAFKSDI